MSLITNGVMDDEEDVQKVAGITNDYFLKSDSMQKRLHSRVRSQLRKRRIVAGEEASDAARRVIELSLMAYGKIPIQLDIFAAMRVNKKREISERIRQKRAIDSNTPPDPPKKQSKKRKKGKIDLTAIPEDGSQHTDRPRSAIPDQDNHAKDLKQRALF